MLQYVLSLSLSYVSFRLVVPVGSPPGVVPSFLDIVIAVHYVFPCFVSP